MIYFTSDNHFNHANIIKYEDRPFANKNEMDETMIELWNETVSKDDTVYILGDFCFDNKGKVAERILKRLNGHKILIRGNHDSFLKKNFVHEYFDEIVNYKELKYNGLFFVLFHYPIAVWNKKHHGAYHLFGHVHSDKENHHPLTADIGDRAYNVGADVNGFKPISIEEIISKLK